MRLLKIICTIVIVGSWVTGCSSIKTANSYSQSPTKEGQMFDSSHGVGGFNLDEAKDMIEFCVDLDSQDDLQTDIQKGIKPEDSIYNPRISKDKWEIVVDSRDLVKSGEKQPDKNGFPPFYNAWTLSRLLSVESGKPKIYALAIRGTIMSSKPSIKEDALATTIAAKSGIEFPIGSYLPITFADMPQAEVHVGFAYGVFSSLFDGKYGILLNLKKYVEPGSLITITGHSQGAAMATLVHAFLHYAMRDKKYDLGDMNYTLKSYVFAQPKPGNNQFSMDFAGIASSKNNAFVLNNTLDSVPQVPLTFQTIGDAVDDLPAVDGTTKAVLAVVNAFNEVRNLVSSHIAGKIAKMETLKIEDLYLAEQLTKNSTKDKTKAVSLNYVAAGNIIPLIGDSTGNYYKGQKEDAFIQHHATSYRKLLGNL